MRGINSISKGTSKPYCYFLIKEKLSERDCFFMGQRIFLAFVVFVFFSFSHIQARQASSDHSKKFVNAGIKAGFNNSNIWDESNQQTIADSKVGFAGGIFITVPIGEYLGVQPEILISQKGYRHINEVSGNSFFFRRTVTYIDIPFQFHINPNELFTLVAGPHYSYLIHQKDRHNYDGTYPEEFDSGKARESNFGFGGGVDFDFRQFVFSIRLMWDFLEHDGDSTNPNYRNQLAQFTVGYKFNKKGN